MDIKRSRINYFILTLVTIGLGIASRKFQGFLPRIVGEYSGDILWALMVFFGFAFLFNKISTGKILLIALIFSFGIEFSQLYQANWINDIRNTTIGGLVLGHGFLFSDLICYSIGILIGSTIDKLKLLNK